MDESRWQSSLKQALLQDPKKTTVMSALLLVLLIVAGRALLSGNVRPAAAAGSLPMVAYTPALPLESTSSSSVHADEVFKRWLNAAPSALSRNDFLIRMDDYPVDPTRAGDGISDGAFWSDVEKSLSIQTDQQQQRLAAVDAIKAQAEAIRPSSVMMGSRPRAMVNGLLLGEGDTIDGFCLVRIEPRDIIVERDGLKLQVPLR